MDIKISIITPVFNRQDCISRCIESVIKQHTNIEHWIIDDGSTDDTLKIISGYAAQYEHIHLISFKKNKGVNAARNAGIKASKGDYIMLLDSDDFLLENAIECIIEKIIEFPAYQYYLFSIQNREEHYDSVDLHKNNVNEIFFKDWLTRKISGDFVHVIASDIFKKFLFEESLFIYEYTTYIKIYKYTGKQLFINKSIVKIETGREDSVSLQYQLTNKDAMSKQAASLQMILNDFYDDLVQYEAFSLINNYATKYLYLSLAIGGYKDFDSMNLVKKKFPMILIRKMKAGFILKWMIILYSTLKNIKKK